MLCRRSEPLPVTRLIDLVRGFCAAKEAEGLSPRSIAWDRMILDRLVGRFGPDRPVDLLAAADLRAWLVELRSTLAPVSIAG